MQPAFFPPKGARPMSDSVLEAPARPELANSVGGEWTPARSGRTYEKRNPANPDEIVGEFPASGEEDVTAAVEAAANAFPAWSAMPAAARATVLMRAADAIEARVEEMAADMTREMGKPLREARLESARTAAIFRYFAGEAWRPQGELYEQSATGSTLYTLRRPLGVVGLITPWNFPAAIPAWKMAPALVYGNTVVLKLAQEAPLTGLHLAAALDEAGIPEGVLNVVIGRGSEVGTPLVLHPKVRAISFTGSVAVGHLVRDQATALGKHDGGKVLAGGERTDDESYLVAPTLFEGVADDAMLSCEEVFGPVTSLYRFDTLDEAIDRANAVEFGLSASIFTNSLQATQEFVKRAEAGMLHVNSQTAGADVHVPFGGIKASGFGPPEQGPAAA